MTGNDAKSLVDISRAVEVVLAGVGETMDREGLRDTPTRVARMYLEMTEGLRTPPPDITLFSRGENDQMVTVSEIEYWSMCEHHLVPFYGRVHVGYIPQEYIAGLSKFARVVDWFAKRPQIQEQMTSQIADHLMKVLSPKGVIVVVEGTHLCMAMRGVRKPNHRTVTSAIRGDIDRGEFFAVVGMSNVRGRGGS